MATGLHFLENLTFQLLILPLNLVCFPTMAFLEQVWKNCPATTGVVVYNIKAGCFEAVIKVNINFDAKFIEVVYSTSTA